MAREGEQKYGPTSGAISGWLGLIACAVVLGVTLFDYRDETSLRWAAGSLVAAVVVWVAMLRPRIVVRRPESVELRNSFSSWLIPLAAVDVVAVRAVTQVEAGGKTYTCAAVGRRIRKMVRGAAGQGRIGDFGTSQGILGEHPDPKTKRSDASTPEAIADLMTEQLLAAAADARSAGHQAGAVTRTWAVPELVAAGVFVVLFVISFLI